MSGADELDVLRSLRADIGILDPAVDLRIRSRIRAGLLAAGAGAADPRGHEGSGDLALEPGTFGPDEFGLYQFDPAPSEADRRSDTPATLRPPTRQGAPAPRSPAAPPSDGAWAQADSSSPRRRRGAAGRSGAQPGDRAPARRLVAMAAALVLLLATGAAVVRTRTREGQPTGIDAAAAPLSLDELVALQRRQPRLELAPGQYQHTHLQIGERRDSIGTGGAGSPLFVVQDRERWVDATGSGREVLGSELARPFDDPAAPLQDIGNAVDAPVQQPRGFAGLSYDDLQSLPTDPDALRQRLLALLGPTSRDLPGLARMTGELLELPTTPPDVRAALLLMLQPDGLHTVGDRTDRLGRRGSGFELDAGGRRWSYIVDRATGQILAWEQRDLVTGVPVSDAVALLDGTPPRTDDTGGG